MGERVKDRALAARGDLPEMMTFIQKFRVCPDATPEQVKIAKAALGSIRTALRYKDKAMINEVARVRFDKLIDLL